MLNWWQQVYVSFEVFNLFVVVVVGGGAAAAAAAVICLLLVYSLAVVYLSKSKLPTMSSALKMTQCAILYLYSALPASTKTLLKAGLARHRTTKLNSA